MHPQKTEYAVQMKGIYKYFGGFCALKGVDLNVKKGTIHSLLGENGAGKSTLMNVLYGLYRPEQGEIYINGALADMKNPHVAIENGIGMVHQHFMLVENFTVTQNIMLGLESTKLGGVLDQTAARKKIVALADMYGLHVDPDAKVQDISVAMQQRVEILKALYRGVEILILDEPTAVLTPQEIEELIVTMHRLTEMGKTIIVITHKLKEIRQSSEYCTIIRRGQYIDTVEVADVTEESLANMMVGRNVNLHVAKSPAEPGELVFCVKDLVVKDNRGIAKVKNLSFELHAGEILGIAGIDGNGQTELVEALTGISKVEQGTIEIHGKQVQNTSPKVIRQNGISTIPEDRHRQGLVLDFTVEENFLLEKYASEEFGNHGLIQLKKMRTHAKEQIEKYDIRPADCETRLARQLSGGNQQKIIIAREIYNDPDLLIAVQPTRGLDVGAIEFVHKALIAQRDSRKAILLISLELEEVMDLSDRINVIYNGEIVSELDPTKTDEKEIGLLMAGGAKQDRKG